MARRVNIIFLDEWLRSSSGCGNSIMSRYSSSSSSTSSSLSARAVIQAWAELRDSLKKKSFNSHHLQSLKILLNSQISLHVADPQAKLLLSILSSPNFYFPSESYHLFLRLLYIWVRKSFSPSSELIDLAVEVLSCLFTTESCSEKSPFFFSEGVLLLGAFSFVPSVSDRSKTVCLELLCRLLEEEYRLISSFEGHVADVLAGIGYALSSSVNVHYLRTLNCLLGIWGKEDGPRGSVPHGLMILHLIEWVLSNLIDSNSLGKIQVFIQETLETPKSMYVPFALVMAAGGALRASSRFASGGQWPEIFLRLRISAENQIESVAQSLISKTGGFPYLRNDSLTGLLLQCISLALARSSSVSSRGPLFICLASALLSEIFPLRHIYQRVIEASQNISARLGFDEIKEHLNSVSFKEAGAITGIFCSQYVSVDEGNKRIVENLIWDYCRDVYFGHRQVALLLRGREDQLLTDVEKIAESAFLMVVLFALSVTKHRLSSKFSQEIQMETSVCILISFSCLEFFRRIRLPEYMDTIRGVVVSVQENESACVSFVESMPSYVGLIKGQGCSLLQRMEYIWSKDEVQTARILFYLRVLPTCIERVPAPVFGRVVAPTMFLYMGHPNEKVVRASHSLFVGFMSSGNDSSQDERDLLKEQIVFYYMQRSLAEYPGTTPFDGMASGVAALVRHLPAGSPAAFYCIHSLVEKANSLCTETLLHMPDTWRNCQGELEPCKKLLELLLRLISLVDVQVLPVLMKLLAQLIVQLPKDGQNMVLNELYSQVAESDDVTRKPSLVSWLQSLSYLCTRGVSGSATSRGIGSEEYNVSASTRGPSNWDRLNAQL